MSAPEPASRHRGRWAVVAAVALVMVLSGEAVASFSVVSHPLTGSGNVQTGTDLSWWVETTVAATTVPASVPAEASNVSGTATQLSSSPASYSINAASAGDPAVELTFVEYPNASHDVYFEVEFTVGLSSGTTVTVKVYLQVQSVPGLPTSSQNYSFYYDLGTTTSSSGFVVVPVDQVSRTCSGRTSCP